MTYEESIPLAKELAQNQLKKGFDVDAFIILYLLQNYNVDVDEIPDSEVDDKIKSLYTLFIIYIKNRNTDNLKNVIETLSKIIDELYHTCETQEERKLFKQFLAKS